MDFSCLVLFVVGVSHFDFEILTSITHRFASKTRLFISIFMSLALYPSNAFTLCQRSFANLKHKQKGLLYQHYARRIEVLEPILVKKADLRCIIMLSVQRWLELKKWYINTAAALKNRIHTIQWDYNKIWQTSFMILRRVICAIVDRWPTTAIPKTDQRRTK